MCTMGDTLTNNQCAWCHQVVRGAGHRTADSAQTLCDACYGWATARASDAEDRYDETVAVGELRPARGPADPFRTA